MDSASKVEKNFKTYFGKPLEKDGEECYLLSVDWISQILNAQNITGFANTSECIDNSTLLDESLKLKSDMMEERDFKIVKAEDWKKLKSKYGLVNDAHQLMRKVVNINSNYSNKLPNFVLDVYPLTLKMCTYPPNHYLNKFYRKSDLLKRVEEDMRSFFVQPSKSKVRLWKTTNIADLNYYIPLPNLNQSLYDAGVSSNDIIVMETCKKLLPGTTPAPQSTHKNHQQGVYWPLTSKHPLSKSCDIQFKTFHSSSQSNGSIVNNVDEESAISTTSSNIKTNKNNNINNMQENGDGDQMTPYFSDNQGQAGSSSLPKTLGQTQVPMSPALQSSSSSDNDAVNDINDNNSNASNDSDLVSCENENMKNLSASTNNLATDTNTFYASKSLQHVPGLSGLQNIGNTCFMNSALQCLSNVPPLTEYFVSKKYLQDINVTNPLGMKGMIAKAYYKLMDCLWNDKNTSATLRAFKDIVGDFAPTFSGYQQHDSQELLIFLLDGLHEDLNRIKKKPYIETKEAAGRKDKEVSQEAWHHFKLRNDSIIVDTFYGQLKSTLVCPECQKISVTFDPFSTLSVPLPYKKERTLRVRIVPYAPDKIPLQCRINVPKNGFVSDLCSIITKLSKIPQNQILVCKISLNRFHRVFNLAESLSLINANDDIFIYEIPATLHDKNLVCLPVYQKVMAKPPSPIQNNDKESSNIEGRNNIENNNLWTPIGSTALPSSSLHSNDFFLPPLIIVVGIEQANAKDILATLLEKMKCYMKISGDADPQIATSSTSIQPKVLNNGGTLHEKLFEIHVGNIYGNVEYTLISPEQLTDLTNIKPLENGIFWTPENGFKYGTKVESGNFIILDWDEEARNKCLNMDRASTVTVQDEPISIINNPVNSTPPRITFNLYEQLEDNGEDNNVSSTTCPNVGNAGPFVTNNALRNNNNIVGTTKSFANGCDLMDCLDTFLSTERLGQDDSWYCPRCKKHQQATKKFDLWKLPPVLVIHLKRFYYTRFFREKIGIPVNFPTRDLDLSSYVHDPEHKKGAKYNLIAVSNHYGEMGYGHYTAFAKNYIDKEWYNFDDTHVSRVNESDVMTQSAYVLFYQRKGTENQFFSPSAISSHNYTDFVSPFTDPKLNSQGSGGSSRANASTNSGGQPTHLRTSMHTTDGKCIPRTGGTNNCNNTVVKDIVLPEQKNTECCIASTQSSHNDTLNIIESENPINKCGERMSETELNNGENVGLNSRSRDNWEKETKTQEPSNIENTEEKILIDVTNSSLPTKDNKQNVTNAKRKFIESPTKLSVSTIIPAPPLITSIKQTQRGPSLSMIEKTQQLVAPPGGKSKFISTTNICLSSSNVVNSPLNDVMPSKNNLTLTNNRQTIDAKIV